MEQVSEREIPAGGERRIPAPDPVARDYLLLALRVGKALPGVVDAYFGPAELKAQVDAEPLYTAARLREDASALEARILHEVGDPDRRRWLQAQLVAFEAQALMLAGDPLPYSDYIACLFDIEPERTPESVFESAADDLTRLVPSGEKRTETMTDRLATWDARFLIAPDRIPVLVDWLVAQLRERADRLVGLPTDERVEFVYVSGGPWSAFNQYEGGCRTLIELNTELVCTPADLIEMAAHECYPGQHTEHAWKERRLVEEMGLLEASAELLNTPQALMTEGLAYLGERIVAPDEAMPDILMELYMRAGLAVAADQSRARDAAERQVRIGRALASLRGVTANAAFMLHAEGAGREDVASYLRRYLLITPEKAEKRLALIEDPICRAEVVVGSEGERLLHRWFEIGQVGEQVDRFGRLLREQLTPGLLSSEVESAGYGRGGL